jgi:hypothetical protein
VADMGLVDNMIELVVVPEVVGVVVGLCKGELDGVGLDVVDIRLVDTMIDLVFVPEVVGEVVVVCEGELDGVGLDMADMGLVREVVGEVVGLLLRVDVKEFEQLMISEVEPVTEQADGQLQGVQDEEPEDE